MSKPANSLWTLTRKQKLDYARRLRLFAEKMRAENDLASAELNDWMADNYSRDEQYHKLDQPIVSC
jgi:hypothetical protein